MRVIMETTGYLLQNVWSEKTLGLIFLKVRKLRKNMQAFRNIVP